MYIDPKHLRGAGRFDLGRYKSFVAAKTEHPEMPSRKPR